MTSPNFLAQNINPMDPSNQVHIPSAGAYNLPPPTIQPTTFALLPSDLSNIVQQLRTILREEISQSIKSLLQDEIQSSIKDAFSTMQNDIQQLKLENSKLRADVDALEQYGRRELVRFSGIVEKGGENTTDIVTEIIKSVDSEFAHGDIIRSHRVGKLNKKPPQNNSTPQPRQIIVRVKDTVTKKRIIKASKNLKDGELYNNIMINEDLTKTRNTLAYRARQLKSKGVISQTWTVDGKIFMKDKREKVTAITTDYGLQKYIVDNFHPNVLNIAYPPKKQNDRQDESSAMADTQHTADADVLSTSQSYAAATALPP